MPELETATPDRLLVCTLKPVLEGEEMEVLPPHLVIHPRFRINPDLWRAFLNAMQNLTYTASPIKLEVSKKAPQIPGYDMQDQNIYNTGVYELNDGTAKVVERFSDRTALGIPQDNRFRPHFEQGGSPRLEAGYTIQLEHMQLISKPPESKKIVEKVFSLRGKP